MLSIEHFINGSSVAAGARYGNVWNPSQGEIQAYVGLGTASTLHKAIDAARAAQPGWAMTNPQRSPRIFAQSMEEADSLIRADRAKSVSASSSD